MIVIIIMNTNSQVHLIFCLASIPEWFWHKLEYNKHLFPDGVEFDNTETRIKWPFRRWKLPFSSSKLPPFKAQNCRYKFSFLRADIFVFRNHQSPITHCQNHNVEKLHVFSCGICLPLEAKCDLLEAKNVLKSNFNISFQANYVILEMYLPLLPAKIFVQLLKWMWFMILKCRLCGWV